MLRGALELSGEEAEAEVVVSEKPGDHIGRYKLLEKIGEGGCGIVYMAEQTEPIRRRVALKIVKLGMDTKQVIARFEAERQALALMDHLNIARVLDAGATDTGRPYFVMELVRGIKITDYCDQHNLSTKERLDLFIQVCHAVQHAHQKGIIHRDLKPSNILVTSLDGVPQPKVIDFGIAKAMQQPLTDKTLFTAFDQFIGTPAYMSPEQAEISGADPDTRSDIYALGVLMYELVTGHTPFETRELLQASLDELRRLIREKEPLRPSTRLRTLPPADLATVARQRQTEPSRLIHLMRGDVNWIVMKCLEKDRTRRYETVNGLARDVERHLNNEPVAAAAPSAFYRLSKFVRRHRVSLATAAMLVIFLVAGLLGSVWQAVRATRAEREQSRSRIEAEAAQEQASQQKLLAETNKMTAELERNNATNSLRQAQEQKAAKEEALRETEKQRANALANLRAAQRAQAGMEEALKAATNAQAAAQGARDQSIKQQGELEQVMGFMLGELSDRLRSIGRVDVLSNVTEKVLTHYKSLAVEAQPGDSLPRVLAAYKNQGQVLAIQGESDKALEAYRTVLKIAERLSIKDPGDSNWQGELSLCHRRIGEACEALGDSAQALAEFQKSLDSAQSLAARAPSDTRWREQLLASQLKIGDVRWAQAERIKALDAYQAAVETAEELVKADTNNAGWQRNLCVSCNRQGALLLEQAGADKALGPCNRGLGIAQQFAAKDPGDVQWQSDLGVSHLNIGDVSLTRGETTRAQEHYQDAVSIFRRLAGTDRHNTEWQRELVRSYFKYARALANDSKRKQTLRAVGDGLLGLWSFSRKNMEVAEILLLPADKGAKPLQALREGIRAAQQLAGQDPTNTQWQEDLARIHALVGDIMLQGKKKEDALREYQETLRIRQVLAQNNTNLAYPQYWLAFAHANMAVTLQRSSKWAEAFTEATNTLHLLSGLVSRWPGNLALLEWPTAGGRNIGCQVPLDKGKRYDFLAAFNQGFVAAQKEAASNLPKQRHLEDWGNCCAELAVWNLLFGDLDQAAMHAERARGAWADLGRAASTNLYYPAQLERAWVVLGTIQLLNGHATVATKSAREGLKLNPAMTECKAILTMGLAFDGQYEKASEILVQNKALKVNQSQTFPEAVLDDLRRLRDSGLRQLDPGKLEKFLATALPQASK